MDQIEQYMLKSRDERRAHLSLIEPCDERGGRSKEFRGLLAHYLNTTVPRGYSIYLCHSCNNDGCSNPRHLYWGTPTDNTTDQQERGTLTSIFDRLVKKHGEATAKQICSDRAKIGAERFKGKPAWNAYTPEQIAANRAILVKHDRSRGWISKCAREANVSPAQMRRFIMKHAQDLAVMV